jgi:hypothetical protein
MSPYQYNTDNLDRRGFISKESILSIVSQEEIFKLVFGFLPVEFDLVHSPLRKDRTPGCWFEYHMDKLRFIDFANSNVYKGIKLSNVDCFDMVQVYFNIPNFYLTLEYIHSSLIRGNESLRPMIDKKEIIREVKPKVKILIESRPFNIADKNYWTQYGIRKKDLVEDKVFPVKKFYALNTKSGHIISDCNDLVFSYNDFPDSRKKLYFPMRTGRMRFLTNCTKNDVGGINSLLLYGTELIITKSYKDYRVLKNNGKNVIWFQNEGMIPNDTIINKLVKHFKSIIVWFDNDQAGMAASEKIKNHINIIAPGKARNLWLPERGLEVGIKDPSDCIAKDKQYFYQFLKDFTR